MSTDNLPAVRHPKTGLQHTVPEIREMAKAVGASRLFGMDEHQAMTLMLLAQAKGIHPIQAVERYHVIQGRPAMKADAMLADFQAEGGKVKWVERGNAAWEGVFSHPIQAPEGLNVRFTVEDARRAELLGNKMWAKYPSNMLRARVISNAIRMILPGIVAGIYTPEEVADFAPDERPALPARATIAPPPAPVAAGPELVAEYREWLVAFVDRINAHWHARCPGGADLINRWRLARHLTKWGRVSGRIDSPADSSAAEADRLAATLFDRDAAAVEAEAGAYCRELWAETRAKAEAGEVAPEDATQEVAEEDEPFDETETRATEAVAN